MSKSENDELARAMSRIMASKDGSLLKKELMYYINKDAFSLDPYETAYQCGQQALAKWLLNLAQPLEK